MITRGIRNNNPFNIRKSNLNSWKGKLRLGTDKDFEQFESMEFGLRAGIVLLRNYLERYNIRAVRSYITRFAPPSENDIEPYISFVLDRFKCFGVSPYLLVDDDDVSVRAWFFILCSAMVEYESNFVLDSCDFNKICDKYNIFSKYEKC